MNNIPRIGDKIVNHEIDENTYKNSFEREVAETLREVGYDVRAGVDFHFCSRS